MVPLPQIHLSNTHLPSTFPPTHPPLTAIFIGGTSGIGKSTLLKLSSAFSSSSSPSTSPSTPKLKIYLIGRSPTAANAIIQQCHSHNPTHHCEFIGSDISLVRNVDEVCRQIRRRERYINLLFLSQGSQAFKTVTSENLPLVCALGTNSRLRFIQNLLPLLNRAPTLRRVVSVMIATTEGAIDLSNVEGRNFPLLKWRNQIASVQTILLSQLSRENPSISFIHTVPGVVRTGISREAQGFWLNVMVWVFSLLGPWIETPIDECGERHLMLATSSMYPPSRIEDGMVGVAVEGIGEIKRGVDGKVGSGMYSVDPKGESASVKVEELMRKFRQDGTAEKVWEYVTAVNRQITGTDIVSD